MPGSDDTFDQILNELSASDDENIIIDERLSDKEALAIRYKVNWIASSTRVNRMIRDFFVQRILCGNVT